MAVLEGDRGIGPGAGREGGRESAREAVGLWGVREEARPRGGENAGREVLD